MNNTNQLMRDLKTCVDTLTSVSNPLHQGAMLLEIQRLLPLIEADIQELTGVTLYPDDDAIYLNGYRFTENDW